MDQLLDLYDEYEKNSNLTFFHPIQTLSIPNKFFQIYDFAKLEIAVYSACDFHIDDKITNIAVAKEIRNQT